MADGSYECFIVAQGRNILLSRDENDFQSRHVRVVSCTFFCIQIARREAAWPTDGTRTTLLRLPTETLE